MSIQTLTNYFLEYGAFFIFLIVLLEYLNLPGFPAGVIMPLSGIWASQGEISFPLVMVLTVAAGLTGSWALYWLGRAGGDKVLGFYFRKFPKQKEAVESKIDMLREKGSVGVFVSKLLPMVRTIISIPAGMVKMDFVKYTISSCLGILIWNLVFVGAGYFFGEAAIRVFWHRREGNVMKIAMLTNNYKPFVGGVPISVERLAKELRKQGHKVTVFAPDYGFDPRYGQVEEDDVIRFQVTRQKMENGMVYPKLVSREIWKGFKEHEFDCIHVHQPMFVGTQALYLGRKYQIPVIYTYHTRYEDYLHYIPFFREEQAGMWRKKLIRFAKDTVIPGYMKWFTNECDLIFAPTPGMQNRIRENGTEVSMAVLPTGLDDSFYIEDEEKTKTIRRQYLGEEKNGHLFCSVSRLEEEKNPIFLLNGIRCLKEKLPFSFRVLLLGEGSMRKELEVLAEQMGLSDTVVFLGNISNEDVKQYLYASELFLFASKSETQGIVLEEAMAAGNPIVAVRASGVEDVVKNGINGYMTEEDVEIWSDKAAELIQSPDYRQVCMEARKTAEGYRASRLAAHAETLYRQCMERKEEMRYEEHTKSGKEHSAVSVLRLFKTS